MEAVHTPTETKAEPRAITDDMRLADLTVGEFKTLINGMLDSLLFQIEQSLPDPDEGLTFKPEVAEYLQKSHEEKGPYVTLEELKRELMLNE